MGDGSVEFDDTAEGLLSLVEHLEPDERTALGPVLHGITPKSEGSARLLLAAYDLVGKVDHVNGALRIAEALAFDLEDEVDAKAVELLGRSVLVWKDSTFKQKDEQSESGAPRLRPDPIGPSMA